MHDEPPGHWYLLVVDIILGSCEIWDVKVANKEKCKGDCQFVVSNKLYVLHFQFMCFCLKNMLT